MQTKKTLFNIVRFGNVLHSSGSVIPIFKKQIELSNTVTVTNLEAKRFFMTIPEAVGLIIRSSEINENRQILVLDMGEPIKIIDLAINMIKLHGKKPTYHKPKENEIKIEIIGLRDGEKESEELSYNKLERTNLEGILRSNEKNDFGNEVQEILKIIDKLNLANSEQIATKIKSIIYE